jgi:hypothetical protein
MDVHTLLVSTESVAIRTGIDHDFSCSERANALDSVGWETGVVIGFFWSVAMLNRWAARRLQREIDALDKES